MVSLVSSYRYDKEVVDSTIANMEAAKLREAIVAKKLDDDELLRVLSTRNIFQLRETFQHYKYNYGTSIDQVAFLTKINENFLPWLCFVFSLIEKSNFTGHYGLWKGHS